MKRKYVSCPACEVNYAAPSRVIDGQDLPSRYVCSRCHAPLQWASEAVEGPLPLSWVLLFVFVGFALAGAGGAGVGFVLGAIYADTRRRD